MRVAAVTLTALGLLGVFGCTARQDVPKATTFSVSFPASVGEAPVDGHVILLLSKDMTREPRTHVEEGEMLAVPFVFGLDVDALAPGHAVVLDDHAFGWPAAHLSAVPTGDYYVQAVLNRYEEFHLADGRSLKLAPDKGEGQQWASKPGNFYSKPVRLHIDQAQPQRADLLLDQKIPPIAEKRDTEFVRHIRIRSELLSKFWGRDVYLGAHILVPQGFDAHPNAHYPLMVFHGHFPEDISEFSTDPPDPNLKPDYSQRFHLAGYNRIQQQEAYSFYQKWISADFPRFLVVEIQHANPYYDDSYAVNSANLGPYGDAINKELIPEIEKRFRGIGQGWARFTYGGSTGGWEALATQVFYPDMYNGAYVACPDPVDFHGYQNIDLYNDPNAFVRKGDFGEVPIAADRKPDGSVIALTGDEYAFELTLGTHGRSTEQWNIWQAVYSPAGDDGYPAQIIDPRTGAINKDVLAYWHDHYDLAAILKRDWPTLGPKLEGKLHFAVGDGDTYFLNNAVHLLQQQLNETRNPHSDATFQYGPGMPHCYTGGPSEYTMQQNNADWTQRVLPLMVEHMLATAPAGADVKSWRY